MHDGKARFLAIANGSYAGFDNLPQAVPDAEKIAKVLHEQHQFEPQVLRNLEEGRLLKKIRSCLPKDDLTTGALILIWIGHGMIGTDNTLRLIARSEDEDVEVATPAQLGEWAARTGARQILIVIDTCYSGSGLVDAARLADSVFIGQNEPQKIWFGVLAASLKDEKSLNGALVRELTRILSEGPQNFDFRWDKSRPYIRGDDLIQSVLEEWNEPRQHPYPIMIGRAWDFIRNPRYEPGLPDQPIEHLLQAARGGLGEESYFTGRKQALGQIVDWIRRGEPGLFVLTGPPGCGKTAVAGRIVSLSSPTERARLLAVAPVPHELDPGEGCVDGHLHARGVTVELASEKLARQLGLDAGSGLHAVLADAERRKKMGEPLLIVVDGLDEAREFSRDLAVEFLSLLARQALLLVATRNVPSDEKTLIQQLGSEALVLDLGEDIEGTRQDIRSYVMHRLEGAAQNMDSVLVAEELAFGGDTEAPQFLLARLITSQLRDHPVDTSSDGWRLLLATTVENALERDLQSVVLTIAGQPHPTAAREMIRALALSYGGGFPADDIWPAVCTAVSPTQTVYTRDDVYAVLAAFGRHIIAGYEKNQPVYRIAHQRLVDYVKEATESIEWREKRLEIRRTVGAAILSEYDKLLDAGLGPDSHTYLQRYGWRHLAQAGPSGLDGLRHLAERHREAFLPDLAAGLEMAASIEILTGHIGQARSLIQEAVGLRRQLTDSLKLAMALFQQAFLQASMGKLDGAEETASEAVNVARGAGNRPESVEVLRAVLVARAHTQLLNGHYKTAFLMAKEAVALTEGYGVNNEKNAWAGKASAYNVAGRAALALQDFETAMAYCQQTVNLVDKWDEADKGGVLINEALLVLATIQFYKSVQSPPNADGKYSPTDTAFARRVLDDYRQTGKRGTISDISVAYCIACYIRAQLIDSIRGAGTFDVDKLHALWVEAIELVRPFADQVMEAALAYAEILTILPNWPAKTDYDKLSTDIEQAKHSLRNFLQNNDFVALGLGHLLSMESALLMKTTTGVDGKLPVAIARQKEAVALLRRSNSWLARHPLALALVKLCQLLSESGQISADDDTVIRAEAIGVWRSLVGEIPGASFQLSALLCDQAARLFDHRTGEAADLAKEAVEVAEHLPKPQADGLLGIAKTNLAAAKITLGSVPETRDLLKQAIELLKPLGDGYAHFLATAYLNLALVELNDEHFAEALPLAQSALEMLDTSGILPFNHQNFPIARIALGRAQRGSGQEALGVVTLNQVIDNLCTAAIGDEHKLAFLGGALNMAAPDFWDEVLTRFADYPDLQHTLNLMRWASPDEISQKVVDIVDALDRMPTTEHRTLRAFARAHRSRAPRAFDTAWEKATGAIPKWLRLVPAHEWMVISWYNTGDLILSRDYLMAHPALLHEDSEIVLEEFDLEGQDKGKVDMLRRLLNSSRKLGVDAAYAPRLARKEIIEWMQSEDPEQHLTLHEELLRPAIAGMLHRQAEKGDTACAVFAAILDLARRGERELAFQAMKNPDATFDHLKAAWRSSDAARLSAIASIIREYAEKHESKLSATVALAVARLVDGHSEEADELIATALAECTTSDIEKLLAIIGEAIPHHPTSAAELARLIDTITKWEQ